MRARVARACLDGRLRHLTPHTTRCCSNQHWAVGCRGFCSNNFSGGWIGYRLETLDNRDNDDSPILRHTVSESTSANSQLLVYTVFIGEVSFRRAYITRSDGSVQPASAMQAKGIQVGELRQDDGIFDQSVTVAEATPQNEEADLEPEIAQDPVATTESANTPLAKTEDRIEEQLIVVPSVVDTSAIRRELPPVDGYKIVTESLMTFGEDSLVLGSENKKRVRKFVERFDEKNDLFSVTGCAPMAGEPDPTAASSVTNARTERVRSELLYAGVPSKKIVIEDCATQVADFPGVPRAVMLSLKRSN